VENTEDTKYIQNIYKIYTKYIQNIYKIYTKYIQNIYKIYKKIQKDSENAERYGICSYICRKIRKDAEYVAIYVERYGKIRNM
jgi:light-regulated signal transduction histidine kinase (bacteriophytochrome)